MLLKNWIFPPPLASRSPKQCRSIFWHQINRVEDQEIKSKPIKNFSHFAQMSKFFRVLCTSFVDLTHANVSLNLYVPCKKILFMTFLIFVSKATIQTDLTGLLDKFKGERFTWIRNRILGTWQHWMRAVGELQLKPNFSESKQKKVYNDLYSSSL